MTDSRLDELTAEAQRVRIGPLWLAEIREACREVSRRFDAAVYAVVERVWTKSEIEELVQDVTAEQLLRQGQLRYILDVAASADEARRLLRHQVRRALVRRRRRTVVDQLLTRVRRLMEGPRCERLPGVVPDRWRPRGSDWPAEPPTHTSLRAAVAAVRMLPKSLGTGDRAPAVYRSEVLSQVVDLTFTAAGTSLSIDDFGNILREVLTSWVPVVLERSDGPDVPGAQLAELSLDLEETVTAVLDALDGTDRTVLRIKLAGAPDSELATALRVSRPTAAKRKSEAFDRLRAAWVRSMNERPNSGRLFVVTDVEDGCCRGMLAGIETELATEVDAVLSPSLTDLGYEIAVYTRFFGAVWITQISRRVGAVAGDVLDQLLALAWSDEPEGVTLPGGVPLQPAGIDPRYPALARMSAELDQLTVAAQRDTVARTSGALTGVFGDDYLAALRADWPA